MEHVEGGAAADIRQGVGGPGDHRRADRDHLEVIYNGAALALAGVAVGNIIPRITVANHDRAADVVRFDVSDGGVKIAHDHRVVDFVGDQVPVGGFLLTNFHFHPGR